MICPVLQIHSWCPARREYPPRRHRCGTSRRCRPPRASTRRRHSGRVRICLTVLHRRHRDGAGRLNSVRYRYQRPSRTDHADDVAAHCDGQASLVGGVSAATTLRTRTHSVCICGYLRYTPAAQAVRPDRAEKVPGVSVRVSGHPWCAVRQPKQTVIFRDSGRRVSWLSQRAPPAASWFRTPGTAANSRAAAPPRPAQDGPRYGGTAERTVSSDCADSFDDARCPVKRGGCTAGDADRSGAVSSVSIVD